MIQKIVLYNSLTREKELFVPIIEGRVGMYVCGPTVYNDVHLGNCRTFVSFDIIYRYLMVAGYKVRYVRNITDVGHLLDDGEDRMAKGARLEQLEPMEIAHKYTNGFEEMMRIFNTLSPSIEPRATGHIIEQISMIEDILKRGYAYQQNGSIYFDTLKFINDKHSYGQLSGRIIDELLTETRDNLKNQEEKRHNSDFALWIKASEEHIMRWPSPWSIGFPGWHLECSAMSTKYLGKTFDLHGGGNDLKFPHHENEIAQSIGACGQTPSNYWLHTNMLLLNGRKMSKSEGNTISPQELFTGNSVHITKAYTPMALKFFMLQAHYRSPLDITDEALQGAEKGYKRLMEAFRSVDKVTAGMLENNGPKDNEILMLISESYQHMNDDFNVPNALASIFELASIINSVKDCHINPALYSVETWKELVSHLKTFIEGIFGLKDESSADQEGTIEGLMSLVIDLRKDIRERKDWIFADKIRNTLQELGIQLKDGKDGTQWSKL